LIGTLRLGAAQPGYFPFILFDSTTNEQPGLGQRG
jgi:hypothetical protein